MLKLLLFLLPLTSFASQDCTELYDLRGQGKPATEKAIACFTSAAGETQERAQKAIALTRLSYLKFFMAENYSEKKEALLFESMKRAEEAMLLFGAKYSMADYRTVPAAELPILAEALYTYGLVVARYVDVKGIAEALKRMDDIKKSMNSILRLKAESVAFYGAHRVLGIFHMKVPAIAGGDIEISKQYLPLAVKNTRHSGELSRYPLNHLVYSDLLYKLGDKEGSCRELRLVAALTEVEVRALDNGMLFESLQNVKTARQQLAERKCGN